MEVGFSSSINAMQSAFGQASAAADRISRQGASGDLVSDTVALKMSEVMVKASAQVVRTIDENLGTLVDILA